MKRTKPVRLPFEIHLEKTVVLTVDPTPETALIRQQPALIIHTQALTFAKARLAKPTFQVFTVAQQNAETPVTISTDSPENFELASDDRPAFGPSLTLTPSSTGTYIHVRYTPGKAHRTKAQLLIEAPYDSQQISLLGQRTLLSQGLYTFSAVSPIKSRPVNQTWLVPVLAGLFTAVLAFAGYYYRHQLISTLLPTAKPVTKIQSTPLVTPALPIAAAPVSSKAKAGGDRKRTKTNRKPNPVQASASPAATEPVGGTPDQSLNSDPVPGQANSSTQDNRLPAKPSPESAPRKAVGKQKVNPAQPELTNPVPGTNAESELEKELNKNPKPNNNLTP